MSSSSTRRLAGISFVTQAPQLPEKLPHMDIAAFVGFASAGPLNEPVVVEDAAHFIAIFGDDLPLAWDDEKDELTYAYLAPAVRAFFRNGGRRCWVIRIANNPETDFFPLPGLASIDGEKLHPAFASARSPGSWFDAFRAATALTVRSIELLGSDSGWSTIYALLSRQDDLAARDLLRLSFAAERQEAFFLVQSVTTIEPSPPDLRRGQVAVQVEPLGTLQWERTAEIPVNSFHITEERWDGTSVTVEGNVIPSTDSPIDDEDDFDTIAVSAGFSPAPGALLLLEWEGGDRRYFQVAESELSTQAGSPPTGAAKLVGRVFSWNNAAPTLTSSSVSTAERLTFELRVQRGDTDAVRILDLGFASTHSSFWNALPTDAQLFATVREDEYETLWDEADELRFPLAGDYDLTRLFIPVGMSALAEPTMSPQNSGRSALERDGLAVFSSDLFLDDRLRDSYLSTLMADADFIRYQTPDAPALTGIYAALVIEEASLIAVPDAIHRGWHSVPATPVPPAIPSAPRAHPSWWHFLECDPPESPPATAREPDRGHFLRCDLRTIEAPSLWVEGPDAADAFTLEWIETDTDLEFILEEATEPDFGDAVELWRGSETTFTILSRTPGIYYYRVRAEASGESSDWSNGVPVQISPCTAWQVESSDSLASSTLLDIHRALLRCCAARGDIMAVLALPERFREDDALTYVSDLKRTQRLSVDGIVRPLGDGEAAAFSYAAIYHPWLIVREDVDRVISTPPDGTATGLIAARSVTRGAWIAPANEAFTSVVSLTPRFTTERYLDLLLAQINLVRQEPRGFLALSADTLSVEEVLRPINVRRLLILLRRAALRLGMTFVFEPNDAILRRVVQGAFESIMHQLFVRGAFAGDTADSSYRVVTDDTINTADDFEQGRFRVDLKVAPAWPMSFLTVRLVQEGERSTATEII
jgi:hypothetical protein